ncbi:exonuclease domain-containing protein [Natronoglycomyces albus]|uniref:Exonuclease domain-containing protein n=1 Tax=Natronoglycomyces albus TaxID=2811108 RepID=A0A895XN19_9ACTN|nr:exonuclease domain-containing protein [Natronoglycomyces albus]QSB04923.1 hypothetical protein JQS30_14325 [Natronoglycomyces albus]
MFAVFDLETTGFSARDRVIEIAIAHLDAEGNLTDQWETLLNPRRDLGSQSIHGIRARDVRHAPTFAQVAGDVAAQLAGRIPVAHNANFDLRMLNQEYARLGVTIPHLNEYAICTMLWATHFLPGVKRSLTECCKAAGISNDRPHEAMSDVMATAQLLSFYLDNLPADFPLEQRHHEVSRWPWPTFAPSNRTLRRSDESEPGQFLDRLDPRSPHAPGPEQAQTYLSALGQALVDLHISATEADQLVALAQRLRIGQAEAADLHLRYLRALQAAAMRPGPISKTQREELRHVAAMLALPQQVVDAEMDSVAEAEPTEQIVPYRLRRGNIVVLTGSFAETKEHWAQRCRQAGLVVAGNVTKKTRLVVAADPDTLSGKARTARGYGIPVISAQTIDVVLSRMEP